MSVTDASVVAEDDAPDLAVSSDWSFVDRLVERLHTEFGDEPQTIRRQVAAVLARFADARVPAFVPILVEKQLRQIYHRRNGRVAPLRI